LARGLDTLNPVITQEAVAPYGRMVRYFHLASS